MDKVVLAALFGAGGWAAVKFLPVEAAVGVIFGASIYFLLLMQRD